MLRVPLWGRELLDRGEYPPRVSNQNLARVLSCILLCFLVLHCTSLYFLVLYTLKPLRILISNSSISLFDVLLNPLKGTLQLYILSFQVYAVLHHSTYSISLKIHFPRLSHKFLREIHFSLAVLHWGLCARCQ